MAECGGGGDCPADPCDFSVPSRAGTGEAGRFLRVFRLWRAGVSDPGREVEVEGWDGNDVAGTVVIAGEVGTFGAAVVADGVGRIVGEFAAGLESGELADDSISFDDDDFAILLGDDPFAADHGDGFPGTVPDGDVVDEREGSVWRGGGTRHVDDIVDAGFESLQFLEVLVHVGRIVGKGALEVKGIRQDEGRHESDCC